MAEAVQVAALCGVAAQPRIDAVVVHRRAQPHLAVQGAGVRVEEELRRVEPVTELGAPRPVSAQPVPRALVQSAHVPVVHAVRAVREPDAVLPPGARCPRTRHRDAQVHGVGVLAEHRDVGTVASRVDAQQVGSSGSRQRGGQLCRQGVHGRSLPGPTDGWQTRAHAGRGVRRRIHPRG